VTFRLTVLALHFKHERSLEPGNSLKTKKLRGYLGEPSSGTFVIYTLVPFMSSLKYH
jgi:hypothetical protein